MIALCCILLAVAGPVSSEMAAPQSSPQTPAFAPGELLVKFRAEVREEAAADFQGWFGISTRKTFAINGYQLVKLPEGADIEEVLEIYSRTRMWSMPSPTISCMRTPRFRMTPSLKNSGA